MCAQIRVWTCLVTDNFGLFTEIAVSNFLHGLVVIWPETFLSVACIYTFSASFCNGALCPRFG